MWSRRFAFATATAELCRSIRASNAEANGAGERTRTFDLLITNQLLYQLSYAGQAGGTLDPPLPSGQTMNTTTPPRVRLLGLAALAGGAVLLVAAAFWFASQRPVVAVAGFDNETGNPAHDALTSGLSDAVVAHLGQIDRARLGVVDHTVQVRMPRSERDLSALREHTGAGFVLFAKFTATDMGLRLSTHLIRLTDGQQVWDHHFDRSAEPGGLAGLEAAVLADVERGVRAYVLGDAVRR